MLESEDRIGNVVFSSREEFSRSVLEVLRRQQQSTVLHIRSHLDVSETGEGETDCRLREDQKARREDSSGREERGVTVAELSYSR